MSNIRKFTFAGSSPNSTTESHHECERHICGSEKLASLCVVPLHPITFPQTQRCTENITGSYSKQSKTYHLVQSSFVHNHPFHTRPYRILRMLAFVLDLPCPAPNPSLLSLLFFVLGTSHTLQNFRFSSPAPVHTTSPVGPMQLHNTRESCASRISITLSILG